VDEQHVNVRIPKYVLVIVLLVCVAGAVGALGFLLGRDSVGEADAHQRDEAALKGAYRDGVVAGRRAAEPDRTYAEGVADGRRAGLRRGYARGADAALRGDRFQLGPGPYYIVRFTTGDRGTLELERSAVLVPGRAYQVCNTDEICFQ